MPSAATEGKQRESAPDDDCDSARIWPRGRPRAMAGHAHAPSGKAATTSSSKIQPRTESGEASRTGRARVNDPPAYQQTCRAKNTTTQVSAA
jgi:hypothetical protein